MLAKTFVVMFRKTFAVMFAKTFAVVFAETVAVMLLKYLLRWHPRQRVKAKWNSDFRFGGKSAAASNKASHAASKSLLFSFVLDTFQAISVIFF